MSPQNIDPNMRNVKTQRLYCSDCRTVGPHIRIETRVGGYWKCVACIKREMAEIASREGKQAE